MDKWLKLPIILLISTIVVLSCSEEESSPPTNTSTTEGEETTIETSKKLEYTSSEWNALLGSPSLDTASNVVITPDGEYIYVIGNARGDILSYANMGENDLIIAKYKANGEMVWISALRSTGNDGGYNIALSPDNRYIYIAGISTGNIDDQTNQGGNDILIVKYDSRGVKVWTKLIGSPSTDISTGIAVSPDNQYIYIVGYTDGSVFGEPHGKDVLIAKLTVEGTLQWGQLLTSNSNYDDEGYKIVVSNDGNALYITGITFGNIDPDYSTSGAPDIFVAKYTTEGTLSWVKQLGTPGFEYASDLTLSPDGNYIYVIGDTQGNLDNQANNGSFDAFIIKYDSLGTKIWTKLFGTPTLDYANAIEVGKTTGYLYISGATRGNLNGLTNNGDYDIFITKHTPEGTILKTILIGSPTTDNSFSITIPSNEYFGIISGYSKGPMPNSTPESTHHGDRDMLISKVTLIDDGVGNLTSCTPTFSHVTDTINIDNTGTLQDIQVGVIISASCTQDVDIYLEHQDACIELSTDNGSPYYHNYGETSSLSWDSAVVFASTAEQDITFADHLTPGYYLPEGSFSKLVGKNVYGAWTIHLSDDEGNNCPTYLLWWGLRLTYIR